MDIKDKFLKMANFFESMFMTNHSCICCDREIADGTEFQLCTKCRKSIVAIEGNVCAKCGESLPDGVEICDRCKVSDREFDVNRSYTHYEDASSNIVKGLKFGHRKYFAENIADMICSMKEHFEGVDVLTYVPISKDRLKQRGFNQAEEIAKGISKKLNIPVVEMLSKVSGRKHQAELSQAERYKNLIGSFLAKNDIKDKVKGKVVMIVDDVFTTGSTLNECAKTLKKLGPKQIKTVTFAKTKFNLSK